MVDSARTKESLMGYIGEKLYGPLDKEEERKEEMDAEPEMEEDDGDELFSVCLHTEWLRKTTKDYERQINGY